MTSLIYAKWACNEQMDIGRMNCIGIAVKFMSVKMLILLVFSCGIYLYFDVSVQIFFWLILVLKIN